MTTDLYSDEALALLAIPARNALLDRLQAEADEAEARWEYEMERRTEMYWEEGPHGSQYAGSEEEARDRFLDSLIGR